MRKDSGARDTVFGDIHPGRPIRSNEIQELPQIPPQTVDSALAFKMPLNQKLANCGREGANQSSDNGQGERRRGQAGTACSMKYRASSRVSLSTASVFEKANRR